MRYSARAYLCPLLIASLFLTGCTATTEESSTLNAAEHLAAPEPPDVEDALEFGLPTRVHNAVTFQIEIPVTNRWDMGVVFDYRFTFLDEQGAELRPEMEWQTGAIGAGETASLRAVSRHSRARDYKLDVRWAEEMTALIEGAH